MARAGGIMARAGLGPRTGAVRNPEVARPQSHRDSSCDIATVDVPSIIYDR
jgi:hypothetical protein